ncbi:MAG: hypothetical protein O3A00_01285 [Planctomycetota bacterium]|nr:hypothetical protein [Planctomycetota bacterium]
MKPEKVTGDATLQSGNRVDRSVNLVFIALVVVVLLTLEIFAMSRVEDRSKTIIETKPAAPVIREFEEIDFGFAPGYENTGD